MSESVRVPNIVGMAFHDARVHAAELGVALAGTDPDGPPIGALAWPGLFYIATQSPSPGDTIERGESIRVTVIRYETGTTIAI